MLRAKKPLQVLHIEESESESQLVRSALRKFSPRCLLHRVSEEKKFLSALHSHSWDLILCDYHTDKILADEAIRHVKSIPGNIPFILIADAIGEELVATLMKEGADDFLRKGNYSRLDAIVKRLFMDHDIRRKAHKAQRRAFEAFASREQMVAIVSHDIKNPLCAIHLEAQMIIRNVGRHGKSVMGEEVTIQAGRILKTAERMKELISDLLEKNKSCDGLKNLHRVSVDPVVLFFESLDNIRPLIHEKNITIKYVPKLSVPKIALDRNKMQQVFLNLLSNAIKFTPHGGEISFDMTWDEEKLHFHLSDNGRGLPPGEEDKIFDKYWSGLKSHGGGNGLGLFICRSIVEAHGGEITCFNSPGKGATFQFFLPREKVQTLETENEDILVVDDDADLCEVMTWALRKEGYKVKAFLSGGSALEYLKNSTPKLIVVDFHLGDMDGGEFLIRKKDIVPDCPVILVSGSPDEVFSRVPARDYRAIVEKPLDLEGLLHEIKNINETYLQRSLIAASRHISHGPASAV